MTIRRLMTALMTAALAGTTAACAGDDPAASGSADASGKDLPPVTLKGMLFGDQPKDLPLVLEEFEKRTKDTLNTKLSIEWNPVSDHKQKVKLMMAAGEEMDFVFDAEFMNLKELVPQGAYAPLDQYYNNDAYPGLKKAFSPEFVEANKRSDGHIYTIPFTQYFYDIQVIYLRKDLREKYGMPPISSYEDLQKFYERVLADEKGMTPLALRGVSGYQDILASDEPESRTVRPILVSGIPYLVHLSDDLQTVKNVVIAGDPASEWAKLPAPFSTMKTTFPQYDKWAMWRKYLEKDVLSQKDQKAFFMSGKAASYHGTLSSYAADRKKLQDTLAGADLEFFVFRKNMREMKPQSIGTNYKSNNSIAIPVTSENIDRTMKFFDWLFASRENHDLFEHGIPGKHWEAVGDTGIKLLSESKNYTFPGYELTWNPTLIRMNTELDDTAKRYFEYSAKADSYYAPVLAKFTFDNSGVKGEFANIASKAEPFVQQLKTGQFPDWEDQFTRLNGELKALGLDKLRAEVQKQVQAYLDGGGQ
ncbi:family 1 extracellular solute-binding protein [Paenibacillus mucilaginosus 3016]|uniref:Family 1 extracellular solute-binding protein n=1 Tax=Paenibacillus mucilaginosus 3016 TaxID=1116391 RepID=H6NA63_9BACL|nr:extracellular solute-binding protein [Paenibacillus mucilaginosus]AFC28907.1 family 1 extracellular solute-binding protein [Paenibacillus mucilaginosus 3016]WFA17662.1 extracellular solute-binding protein [Paenibacillus mucilaginosus]